MTFSPAETTACRRLIELALDEDLGHRSSADLGDVTSRTLFSGIEVGQAVFVSRQAGVLAGLPAVPLVLASIIHPNRLNFEPLLTDGARLEPGRCIAQVHAPIREMLTAERTALNFLQHLSGVATLTRRYVDAIVGLPVKILDTRKTIPGWRLLEKYAVRCGGGQNHRMGLYDGILIKDNHWGARHVGRSLSKAIEIARRSTLPFEIEVDTLEQLDEALAGKPDIVLLDNMNLDQLRQAVHRRDEVGRGVLLEASGGVTLETVRAIAETGVDRISVGALTHSAPALDIGLDYLP